MIQWTLLQDIQYKHSFNTKDIGTVSQPVKACTASRQDAGTMFLSHLLMDISDRPSFKDFNNMSSIHLWVTQ